MFHKKKRIGIVYGVYINNKASWRKLIKAQLQDLKSSGVLSEAEFHIVVTNPLNIEIGSFFLDLDFPVMSIEVYLENQFEYPALRRVHQLSFCKDYAVIVYFHSKGMSHVKPYRRNVHEIVLTNFTFFDWRKILLKFESDSHLGVAGVLPGEGGDYVWVNFWWASSRYLRSLNPPVPAKNRFVHEFWLTERKNSEVFNFKILNIVKNNEECYDQRGAIVRLRVLLLRNFFFICKKQVCFVLDPVIAYCRKVSKFVSLTNFR
jgi:hypothetical protein